VLTQFALQPRRRAMVGRAFYIFLCRIEFPVKSMKFQLDEEAIEELFGGFSFRKLVDPEGAEVFLKGYADMVKGDRWEEYDETLYVIERKQWVENGFKKEGFSILGEVVLGHLNTGLLETLRMEECLVKERLHLERLHFFAEKKGMLVEAYLGFLDKPAYAVVSARIEVPWSLTGGGAVFKVDGQGDLDRVKEFFDVAGAYRGAVADMIMDLAERHRVVVDFIWHVTSVYAYPRKDFKGALRRIQNFLKEYDPAMIRKEALHSLNARTRADRCTRAESRGEERGRDKGSRRR